MKRLILAAFLSLAFAGGAYAQAPSAADLKAVGNNLGPTVEALADGLGNTLNTLISTQSAVQTSAALGSTIASTAQTAVSGAPSLVSLGTLAFAGNYLGQKALKPYLTAIDNPTSANIQAALAPGQINTIAGNLQSVPYVLIEGAGYGTNGNGLRSAGVNALKGRLLQGVSENAFRDTSNALSFAASKLTSGTNLAPLGFLFSLGSLGVCMHFRRILNRWIPRPPSSPKPARH